ncbi:UDP-N-acetylmuramate--alanine ligase, partial [Campylobacter jejuni CVM 41902]
LAANLKEFARAFESIDELVILPVYAAGEEPIELDLKAVFPKALFVEDIKREGRFLVASKGQVFEEGLIIGFGAGDISNKLYTYETAV